MRFITDMGRTLDIKVEGSKEPPMNLGRYGVWDTISRKPEVIATGDNLEELQTKYGPGLEVKLIPGRGR